MRSSSDMAVSRDNPSLLAVSPHPDDEILGAGATLMALRDAGWRVVNLACGLGRDPDRERRRAELIEACRRARFELVVPEGDRAISESIAAAIDGFGVSLVAGPSPHDIHPTHEAAGR